MLKFLGRGSAFNTKEGDTSAYIKENGVLFLIDCGSNIFEKIIAKKLLDGVDEIYVAITHRHADHIGSLGSLILYCCHMLNKKISILCNDDYVWQYLLLNGVVDEKYNIHPCCKIDKLDLEVTFKPASHAELYEYENGKFGEHYKEGALSVFHCNSLYIRHRDKHFYYSGDSSLMERETIHNLENGSLDYIYQDCCSYFSGNLHMSYQQLYEAIQKEYRHKVYIMHMDTSFDMEKAVADSFRIVEITD